jgi:hypothetical protein
MPVDGRLVIPAVCHEHARRRLARDLAAGFKVFDDRESSWVDLLAAKLRQFALDSERRWVVRERLRRFRIFLEARVVAGNAIRHTSDESYQTSQNQPASNGPGARHDHSIIKV